MHPQQIQSRRREPLSRTGVELSLVRMRGSLENLQAWVGDSDPTTGLVRLEQLSQELRAWPVLSDQAEHVAGLSEALWAARRTWATGGPEVRLEGLLAALAVVHEWLGRFEVPTS